MKHHPVFDRWPPNHLDRIQLCSINSPNGIKIGMALEETELAYKPHVVNLFEQDQFTPEYMALSPNSKIPAIIDPDGPDGQPSAIMGDAYTIADIAVLPRIRSVKRLCETEDHLDLASCRHLNAWYDTSMSRPASPSWAHRLRALSAVH